MLNEAVAALSRGVLNFPKTAVGSKSTVKKVPFSNPGTVAIGITSISVTGADTGDFAQTSTCGNSLAIGKSCTVSVDFQPTQKGKRSAVLTFNDTTLGGLQAVPLAGTAY
jgi:Abnormal spindle-like microcephaly-assoc'd, ASPM-SPD-2-Hydin